MAGVPVQVTLWSSSAVSSVWLHISEMVAASLSFQFAFQSEEWERVKSKGQRVKGQPSVVSIWKTSSETPSSHSCLHLIGHYMGEEWIPGS